MAFRSAISKPTNEDVHLTHILRFYMTRAMHNRGEQDTYLLPLRDITQTIQLVKATAKAFTPEPDQSRG